MAEAVYILCALTSLACAVLLLRAWRRTRLRLLLWSGLCFAWLVINNLVLFADWVLFPELDLSLVRSATALAGVSTLLFGLIWDGH
jgi:hypothetical protein